MKYVLTILFGLWTTTLFGQMLGPSEVEIGSLTILNADAVESDVIKWRVLNPPPDYVETVRGKELFFSTKYSGRYFFILAHTIPAGDQPPGLEITIHTLEVLGGEPVDPIDPINPDNPVKPSKFGLDKKSYDLAIEKLFPLGQIQNCDLVADAYEMAAEKIEAGEYKNPSEVRQDTSKLLRQALMEDFPAWREWGEAMSLILTKLDEDGKLDSLENYGIAWKEIAAGLMKAGGKK